MTPKHIEAARRLVAAAEIAALRLVEAKASYRPAHKHRPASDSLVIAVRHSGHGRVQGDGQLHASISFHLVGREGQANVLQIACSFEITYVLPKNLDPRPAEVRGFCATNALFNAWPYWREYVQNMVARMNLPPLTLPLLRIGPPSPVAAERILARSSKAKRTD